MQKDKISIIIPIYNSEITISKCISSIVGQTYKNIEIILVDDGSIDNSLKICNEWMKKDKRIKVIHKKNEGVACARNVGIENADGEYIGFVDSDDYIDKRMYEELWNKLKKYDSDMAVCKYRICNGKKNILLNSEFKEDVIKEEKIIPMFLQGEVLTAHLWNKLYKKQLFKDLKFNKYNMLEDMDIMYLVLERCKRISYINEGYYYYVYNNMSLTRQYNISMLSDFQQVIMKMFKHYDNRDDIKKYLNYNKTMVICTLFENIAKSNTELSSITIYKKIYMIFKESLMELRKKDKVLYNKFTTIQKLKINLLNFNVKIFIIFNRIMRGMIKI